MVDGSFTYYYKHPKGDTGPATVVVTEIKAPPNYVLDSEPQTVIVNPTYAKSTGGGGEGDDDAGGGARAGGGDDDDESGGEGVGAALVIGDRPVLTFINEDEPCSSIVKYQKGRPDILLAGAQFHIEYADQSVSTDFWDEVTDENSEIHISMKKPGTLIVKETQAPENYKIITNETPRMIVIQRGDHATMKVPNEAYNSILIKKKDIDDGRMLAGATFKVTRVGKDGDLAGSENAGWSTTVTTGEDGTALVQHLEPGTYEVEEISPPPFYSLSDNPIQTVTVLEGSHEAVEIEFYNEAFTGMRIIKVDAKTGKGLAGAVFSIYKGDGVRDGEPTGDLVGNYTTDMNGIVFLDRLERGKYTVVEEQAPDVLAPGKTTVAPIV